MTLPTTPVTIATSAAAVTAAVAGGVFFAFSTFVMTSLRKLPPQQGIAAMQSINRQAPTPVFMTVLFGTAALSVGLGVHAAMHRNDPQAAWVIAGSASYLVAIAMTAAFHVPRNDKLATFDAASSQGAAYWADYASAWTAGSHVRTIACIAASAFFVVAARRAA